MGDMAGMEAHAHQSVNPGASSAELFFMGESSATAVQPTTWPMPMVMAKVGADKLYSTNWGMLGGGGILLRTILSLEPATVTERRYPLLFQTGETAFGEPITNAQHPHSFIMELSVQYAHNFGERAIGALYYGIVDDPALGPVAYPHRASAMEIPHASLGHHWQDSTHIASNALTGVIAFP